MRQRAHGFIGSLISRILLQVLLCPATALLGNLESDSVFPSEKNDCPVLFLCDQEKINKVDHSTTQT